MGTALGFELVLSTLSEDDSSYSRKMTGKCWRGYISHDWTLTDFWMSVSLWSDMKMQGCPHDKIWKFRGLTWVGPSAELRCPEEEGLVHSTPSAARPWRGGWGRAGGHQTPPGADWEGLTRRCLGQWAGPANTGANITGQNTRQSGRDMWDKDTFLRDKNNKKSRVRQIGEVG